MLNSSTHHKPLLGGLADLMSDDGVDERGGGERALPARAARRRAAARRPRTHRTDRTRAANHLTSPVFNNIPL